MGSAPSLENHDVILFDGVCNLCNSSVNFIIDRDHKKRFYYASLQSEEARELLASYDFESQKLDSVMLVSGDNVYDKSTAALMIASELTFPWNILKVLLIIPKFLRDPVYNFIAKNRYRWFGKRETCRLPAPDLKDRFLHSE